MAKNNPYFQDFISMGECSVRAAEFLKSALDQFDPIDLNHHLKVMHEIEHAEDMIKHDMMKRLVKEFVTPIDREDIIQLANELDTVTDTIEEVLIRIYMYNLGAIRPEVLEFTTLIVSCCKSLQTALIEFPNFRKSTTLMQAIIDVNSLEGKGDALHVAAVRNLYTTETDALLISSWREIFDRLEDCCDACEDVADALEIVGLKNS